MAEREEALAPVIASHAAVANPSERQIVIGNMHDGVVDAGPARGGVSHKLVPPLGITKIVQRQRFFALVNECNGLFEGVVANYGQDGTKDFILHYRRIRRNIVDNGRLDVALAGIRIAAESDCPLLQIRGEPLIRRIVNNASVIRTLTHIGAMHFLQTHPNATDEGLFEVLLHQYIVRRDAGLSGVDGLAPGYTPRRNRHIGMGIYNTRTLTAQLQHHRREVFSGRFHHHLTYSRAAGKKDEVEPLTQQDFVGGTATLHHRHMSRIKNFIHNFFHDAGCVRSVWRRLE